MRKEVNLFEVQEWLDEHQTVNVQLENLMVSSILLLDENFVVVVLHTPPGFIKSMFFNKYWFH
jgi:hypothetical protein